MLHYFSICDFKWPLNEMWLQEKSTLSSLNNYRSPYARHLTPIHPVEALGAKQQRTVCTAELPGVTLCPNSKAFFAEGQGPQTGSFIRPKSQGWTGASLSNETICRVQHNPVIAPGPVKKFIQGKLAVASLKKSKVDEGSKYISIVASLKWM